MLELVFFWSLLPAIAGGLIAGSKGRNSIAAAIGCIFLSWLGVLLVALRPKRDQEAEGLRSGMLRRCPACAESIRREASRCRYCQQLVEPLPHRAGQLETFAIWLAKKMPNDHH